mmetsp:Transcript_28796/g.44264  ORF Transcript_28796/g.44264 Transcript_28796/m.44264 type:complete len:473 (-) Transcript_28796:337-1755(-)
MRNKGLLASPASGGAKENTGASAKKRRQKRLATYVIGGLVSYVGIMTIYQAHFAGMFVPDVDVDPSTGKARIRRRPDRTRKRLNPDESTTDVDAILEGYLTLVDLQIPPSGLQGPSDQKYRATASFCAIDWKLQQQNPSTVAMFRDLKYQSTMCDGTLIKVDLYDIVTQAKEFDAKVAGTKGATHVVPTPNGVVFHETRCGSTLAANLMASITTKTSRVYSESPPPVTALRACDRNPCNPQLHVHMIRDVVYLMGRSMKPLDYLFFKIQSIGTMAIDKFTEAFPDVPWVFVYRDSVEIMQSHMKGVTADADGGWMGGGAHTPVCARNYRMPTQPATTALLLQEKGFQSPEELSITQYCAAHLGALSLSALQEHKRTGKGRFVNYNTLPDVMWDSVIPQDFQIDLAPEDITKMQQTSGVYSKGRGQKANQEWQEDSTKKQSSAAPVVVQATKLFMDDIYNQMEALSAESSRVR